MMNGAASQEGLKPDRAAMGHALEHLFGGDVGGLHNGLIEIAYSDDQNNIRRAQLFGTDQLEEAADFAFDRNSIPGANVYYGAALRKPETNRNKRAQKKDVFGTVILWNDWDYDDEYQLAREKMSFCPPTMGIVTGRIPTSRRQAVWRLNTAITDIDEIERSLAGIQGKIGGDPKILHADCLMRLAGSIAWPKPGKPDRVAELTRLHVDLPDQPRVYETEHVQRAYPPTDPDRSQKGDREDEVTRDGLGRVLDGRETFMYRCIAAALGDFIRANYRDPTIQELFDAAWPNYKAFAKPRGASLEADGRGETLFREKCASTLRRFKEGKIRGLESVEAVIIDDAARKGVAGLTVAQAREAPIERHLQVDNLGDFLKLEIPPKELILEPWLPAQGICMLFAYRGIGKTFVALGIGLAVASGGTFLKWSAPKARKVLYIDGEMPAAVMQERICSMTPASTQDLPPEDYFRLFTPDRQEYGVPDLSTPEGQAAFEPYVAGVDLVIIDNISTLCRSGIENEAESWLPIQEWALGLRRRGISVFFVHHAGKTGNQRGTSRREDVLDTVISLKRPSGYSASSGAHFEVHYEKARGFAGVEAAPFEAMLVTQLIGGQATWTIKDMEDALTERVVSLGREGLTQREIAEELDLGLGTVNRRLKDARETEARTNSHQSMPAPK